MKIFERSYSVKDFKSLKDWGGDLTWLRAFNDINVWNDSQVKETLMAGQKQCAGCIKSN